MIADCRAIASGRNDVGITFADPQLRTQRSARRPLSVQKQGAWKRSNQLSLLTCAGRARLQVKRSSCACKLKLEL